MTTHLHLIRHGSTGPIEQGLHCGSSDVALSEGGLVEARALGAALRLSGRATVYVSPLLRARQTAAHCFAAHRLRELASLREIDLGAWELQTWDAITTAFPDHARRWRHGVDRTFAFPDGESLSGFIHRCAISARRFAREPSEEIIVVAHGGVIRLIIATLLGLDPIHAFFRLPVATASLSSVQINGDFASLRRFNWRPQHG